MSKSAAATDASHRLPAGRCFVSFVALVLLPGAVLAAETESALRRSDQIDLKQLGTVSEDERSVLRMEWRAGMAGVEETRSVQDMFDKLQRMGTSIGDVSQLVRNMPTQAFAVATPAPLEAPASVVAAVPIEAKAPATGNYDTRLMVANLAALALVALWWFRRRKLADLPGEALPPPPQQAPAAGAILRKSEAPITMSPGAAPVSAPAAPTLPEPAEMPEPIAEAAAPSASEAPDETTSPLVTKPAGPAEQVAAPAPAPVRPQPAPAESFDADKTMVLDLSLEEAGPETVARENARLAALRVRPSHRQHR